MRSNRKRSRLNLSSHAKVRSTRIRKAWMAALNNRLRPRLVRLRLRGFSLMLGIIPALKMHLRFALDGLLTAFEKNGHAICPCIEAPQDDISLRQTRIGWPCSLRSIAQSPTTISPRTRRFAADNPAVLTQ